MKNLVTYESFLSKLFKVKKSSERPSGDPYSKFGNDANIVKSDVEFLSSVESEVKDCFIDVVSENQLEFKSQIWIDQPPYIEVKMFYTEDEKLKAIDFIESFRFANDYLSDLGLQIERFTFYIFGYYDICNWQGDIYYNSLEEIQSDINSSPEAMENIEEITITIKRK